MILRWASAARREIYVNFSSLLRISKPSRHGIKFILMCDKSAVRQPKQGVLVSSYLFVKVRETISSVCKIRSVLSTHGTGLSELTVQ